MSNQNSPSLRTTSTNLSLIVWLPNVRVRVVRVRLGDGFPLVYCSEDNDGDARPLGVGIERFEKRSPVNLRVVDIEHYEVRTGPDRIRGTLPNEFERFDKWSVDHWLAPVVRKSVASKWILSAIA